MVFSYSKLKLILLATVTIGCIAAYSTYANTRNVEAAPSEPKTVAVVPVKRQDLSRKVNLTAELRPFQDINIHAKVAGYLKAITVDVGDQVKAGQVLATLDLAEQQADLASAKASYKQAKLDYDRIEAVTKKKPGLLADDEVDKARAAFEVAKAKQDHALVMSDYSTITSPFDGVITKRYADPGALIQAGTSSSTQAMPIVHLSENTKLRLVFPVPESIVPQVKVGIPVTVTIPATGDMINSTVARTSGLIETSTRTMEVEVDVDNSKLRLTPGMYASVAIDLQKKQAALTVPPQAIANKDTPSLWVVDTQGDVKECPVTLGIETPKAVEVVSGVEENQMVVFGSRSGVNVGMKVTPKLATE